MHSINVLITLNDGHQELIEQICQLLCDRGIDICAKTESQISTNIVAERLPYALGIGQEASSIELDQITGPETYQQDVEDTAVVVVEPPPAEEVPVMCKITQLSIEDDIPVIIDTNVRVPTLCVKNLETIGKNPSVAMFNYCNRSYKIYVNAEYDVLRLTTVYYFNCTVQINGEMLRMTVMLKDSDECCLCLGSNVLRKDTF